MSNFDQPKTISFTPADERGFVVGGTISNMEVGSLNLNVGPSGCHVYTTAPRPSDTKAAPSEPKAKDMHTSGHGDRTRPARMMTPMINCKNPWVTVSDNGRMVDTSVYVIYDGTPHQKKPEDILWSETVTVLGSEIKIVFTSKDGDTSMGSFTYDMVTKSCHADGGVLVLNTNLS